MDADTLRLLLIIAGGSLLVGLYIWERRRARPGADEPREDREPDADKLEPQLGPWNDEADGIAPEQPPGAPWEPDLQESPDQPPVVEDGPAPPENPLILLLHITPRVGVFTGEAIAQVADHCGIEPGEKGIFQYYADTESPEDPLFSVANLVKPGTFPFGAMAEFESPGLILFSLVQGAPDDPSRLVAMLTTAHCLATELQGQIRDKTMDLLTPEAAEYMQEQVHELMARRLTGSR